MTRREELLALAERVEGLTGPDREVNKALALLAGLRLVEEGHPLGLCCYDENGHGVPLPNFTASLAAAMSLRRPNWAVTLSIGATNIATVTIQQDDPSVAPLDYEATAQTPEAALLAALLRALAKSGQ